jgi:hypothetical protein
MRGMRGARPGGMGRMGPRVAPLRRLRPLRTPGVWRRPMWGWYPIHGPYMWGVGCLLPAIAIPALLGLALLRFIF